MARAPHYELLNEQERLILDALNARAPQYQQLTEQQRRILDAYYEARDLEWLHDRAIRTNNVLLQGYVEWTLDWTIIIAMHIMTIHRTLRRNHFQLLFPELQKKRPYKQNQSRN